MNKKNEAYAERLHKARSILENYQQALEKEEKIISYEPPSKEFQEARSIAISFIGLDKGKSSGRVRDKLRDKNYDNDLIDKVIASLIKDEYLNDRLACAKITRRHSGSKSKSRAYMKQLFISQGVDEMTATDYLEELEPDEVTIKLLLPEEIPTDHKEKARLYRRLQSRGYSYSTIQAAVAKR